MSNGNGESHLTRIQVLEIRPGWTIFQPEDTASAASPHLPGALNHAVVEWVRDRPGLDVQASLGIVSEGRTVAVQLWYAAQA